MILGLGTDIVEIVRVGEMIERHGEHFLQRVYTEEEIRYCQDRKNAAQHFAGRWGRERSRHEMPGDRLHSWDSLDRN